MRVRKEDLVTARVSAATKKELMNASRRFDLSQSYLINKGLELVLMQLKNNKQLNKTT